VGDLSQNRQFNREPQYTQYTTPATSVLSSQSSQFSHPKESLFTRVFGDVCSQTSAIPSLLNHRTSAEFKKPQKSETSKGPEAVERFFWVSMKLTEHF
jgi:hypothetical protein